MKNKINLIVICLLCIIIFFITYSIKTSSEEELKKQSLSQTMVTQTMVTQTNKINLSPEDEDMLLRIGMCEAGGESVECIANVMLVVLNRVEDNGFPNNIKDVLYEENQFTPVTTGWFEIVEPEEKCYIALDMLKDGWDESQDALYFESCEGESWHSQNLKFLFEDGKTRFYTNY